MNTQSGTQSNQRLIGRYHGTTPGPCVMLIAGLHGNEPDGVDAARRVLHRLQEERPPFQGDLHAFRGNLSALEEGGRFVDRDLNRLWTVERMERIRLGRPDKPGVAEHREQRELHQAMETAMKQAGGESLVIDLHTSSGPSVPFVIDGHGPLARRAMERLSVPMVFDTSGYFSGALMTHLHRKGHSTFAFEAGRHETKEAIENHLSAIWLTLASIGALRYDHLPAEIGPNPGFDRRTNGLSGELELFYRHTITPDDAFEMMPGFSNFDSVRRGRQLGRDRHGLVLSPADGRIFLPLYQKEGDDGFFLVRRRAR